MGVKAHGTLGVLTLALRMEWTTKEKMLDILADIPHKSSLHIRADLLREVINNIKNDSWKGA